MACARSGAKPISLLNAGSVGAIGLWVGEPSPNSAKFTSSFLSSARNTARRTRTSLNGGLELFSTMPSQLALGTESTTTAASFFRSGMVSSGSFQIMSMLPERKAATRAAASGMTRITTLSILMRSLS
ncbi:Uncharacterised protein [Bordetella pertussis]|nr:Uncharacterised protein [Bordetella pertussis]